MACSLLVLVEARSGVWRRFKGVGSCSEGVWISGLSGLRWRGYVDFRVAVFVFVFDDLLKWGTDLWNVVAVSDRVESSVVVAK